MIIQYYNISHFTEIILWPTVYGLLLQMVVSTMGPTVPLQYSVSIQLWPNGLWMVWISLTPLLARCYFPSLWTGKCKAQALFSVRGGRKEENQV